MINRILTVIALLAISVGIWQLLAARHGLEMTATQANGVPVTVYQSQVTEPAPVVVIAHGFAGSQQLMQPFAVTLDRNGYIAISFDFPGHGRNPEPLPGGLLNYEQRTESLLAALEQVMDFASEWPGSDGRLALLGHSMAADVLMRYAAGHPEVAATVAVSPYIHETEMETVGNLLIIYGALEPAELREMGKQLVAAKIGRPTELGVTYGAFAEGSARRVALAAGAEHIGVLYAEDSLRESLEWLDQTFQRSGEGFIDARGLWLALLLLGVVLLVRPLSRLLPEVAPKPVGGGYHGRWFWVLVLAPAVLTPLLLWPLPHRFLPLLLGDYLVLHFALYGVLTTLGMGWLRAKRIAQPVSVAYWALVVAVVAATLVVTLAVALPMDAFIASFIPTGQRIPLVWAMFAGTLWFFCADEWLTRNGPRAAYLITKLAFLLSLILAIALNLRELFFLLIIIPAILLFFIVYGLFSRWLYQRTQHPWGAGLANAFAFAWAIAVTFPVVGD